MPRAAGEPTKKDAKTILVVARASFLLRSPISVAASARHESGSISFGKQRANSRPFLFARHDSLQSASRRKDRRARLASNAQRKLSRCLAAAASRNERRRLYTTHATRAPLAEMTSSALAALCPSAAALERRGSVAAPARCRLTPAAFQQKRARAR